MSEIRVPISAGELLDKITILRIKERRIADPEKLANVRNELRALEQVWRAAVSLPVHEAEAQLTHVNETLWNIEDHIRDGDYVIVERTPTARSGETVVALLEGGEATLKRFYRDNGRIRLQPANGTMAPIIVDRVDIQGVVVGVFRKL